MDEPTATASRGSAQSRPHRRGLRRVRRWHGRHVVRRRAALPHLLPGHRLWRHHAPGAGRAGPCARPRRHRPLRRQHQQRSRLELPARCSARCRSSSARSARSSSSPRTAPTRPRPAPPRSTSRPIEVGAYFNKIACFCFTDQTLKPGEKAEARRHLLRRSGLRRRSRPRDHRHHHAVLYVLSRDHEGGRNRSPSAAAARGQPALTPAAAARRGTIWSSEHG